MLSQSRYWNFVSSLDRVGLGLIRRDEGDSMFSTEVPVSNSIQAEGTDLTDRNLSTISFITAATT